MTIEVLAQICGKAIDVATELEQGVVGRPPRERSDGDPDRL
jgi:hypothetical protein